MSMAGIHTDHPSGVTTPGSASPRLVVLQNVSDPDSR
jgi:hypothetical protein